MLISSVSRTSPEIFGQDVRKGFFAFKGPKRGRRGVAATASGSAAILSLGDLRPLLERGAVAIHPFAIGEIALGELRQREQILTSLHDLPHVAVASDQEMLRFIAAQALFGLGTGYVDAHLLAATRLTGDAALWTRDTRLRAAAQRLALAADLPRG